jgi:peptidoglycan/LPS O-acetylase OafA/YrhL
VNSDFLGYLSGKTIISRDTSFIFNLIRAIAAELVLISHLFDYSRNPAPKITLFENIQIGNVSSLMGRIGVVLFFIISGILISNSIFSKLGSKNYCFKSYFIDRFARIFSGLVPALLFIAVIDGLHLFIFPDNYHSFDMALHVNATYSIVSFIASLFMVSNFPIGFLNILAFGSGLMLWTVVYEWWLYLMFGWLVINFRQYYTNTYRFLIILGCFSVYPLAGLLFEKQVSSLIMIWFVGVLITSLLLSAKDHNIGNKPEFLYLGLFFGILALMYGYNFKELYDLTPELLLAIAVFFVVLNYLQTEKMNNRTITSFVRFEADYSYSLYLVHIPVIILVSAFNLGNFYIIFIAGYAGSHLVAIIMAYFTEMRHKQVAAWIKQRML